MAGKTFRKKVILRSIYIIAFFGYSLSVAFLLRYMSETSGVKVVTRSEAASSTPIAPETIQLQSKVPQYDVPVRLVIPSIQVSANVMPVGVTADGSMDIRKNPDETAWYKLGPNPGNTGNAVIAGHYGWSNGKGSVFNKLHSLKPGDTLSVVDEKNASASFVVRESRSYDPAADATAIFKSVDGKSHLNLITCEGTWSNTQQTYSGRLVVFTDKI